MRKSFVILFCLSLSIACFGQSDSVLTSKKGKPILPQKGQFAVGISANPLLSFTGNLFSSSGQNKLNAELLSNNLLFGKYLISTHCAVRLKLGINKSSYSIKSHVQNDNNFSATINDELVRTLTSIQIVPGIERRRGISRLQVTYGGELVFGIMKNNEEYKYGNGFAITNPNPTTTVNFESKEIRRVNSRPVLIENSNSVSYGVRSFLGVEYFFLPKISVGCEMGLRYIHSSIGKSKNVREFWDFTGGNAATLTEESEGFTTTTFGTDIFDGQIYLLFYF